MAGSLPLVELAMRHQRRNRMTHQLVSLGLHVVIINVALEISHRPTDSTPSAFPAHSSALATLHKLLKLHTFATGPHGPGLFGMDAAQAAHIGGTVLRSGLADLLARHASSSAEVGVTGEGGSCSSGGSSRARPSLTHPKLQPLRQVAAIMVMVLTRVVQLQHPGRTAAKEQSFVDDARWIAELARVDPDMGLVAKTQFLSDPRPGSIGVSEAELRRVQGTAWEQLAWKGFDGRLLPGCCHLGCTNMAGASEATLPTRVCSGCRQARYCSVECQRAAWLGGGHAAACRLGI
ncbi:MAG: hypothetical protein WDW38_009300 [Sanguina aurantia]